VTEPRATDETLADVERPTARLADDGKPLDRGATVGRYVVLAKLGAGGMGIVYAAYDPELDRKVALKLLRTEGAGTGASEGRTRLLREAQALAKLSHPNVVAIHDVGTHGEQVFLAMEFVEGTTLGEWAKEERRSWREKLRAIVDAGHGVAAAHAAGLLHRDLKPENIMVGKDGRVRVMDLGLARAVEGPERVPSESPESKPSQNALAASVTRAGAVVGTPAYMAPEQHLGLETDERTDQFSLSLTAWEVLFGERPFTGVTLAALAFAVTEGKIRPAPKGAGVPAWLERVLKRGLAADREQRWPNVDALLVELGRGHTRARTQRMLAGVAVMGLVAAGFAGWRRVDEQQRIAACEEEGASMKEVWNDDGRSRFAAIADAAGATWAPTTVTKAAARIDDYVAAWSTAREEACLAATVSGTLSPALYDAAVACLDERRIELDELVTSLLSGRSEALMRAATAVARLPLVAGCRDPAWLTRRPAAPGAANEKTEVGRALASASALVETAGYDEAARRLADAKAALGQTESVELVVRHRIVTALLAERRGDFGAARAELEEAFYEAGSAGLDDLSFDAAVALTSVVGDRLAEAATGRSWAKLAGMLATRLQLPDGPRLAGLHNNLGNLEHRAGDFRAAAAEHRRTLEIREPILGAEHPDVAASLLNLGNALHAAGDVDEALASYRRSAELLETAVGAEHPAVATALDNLGVMLEIKGALDEAAVVQTRGLAIRERALGPDHVDVAFSLSNLANVRRARGELAEALEAQRRALGILERKLGPDHPNVASVRANLGNVYVDLARPAEALALYDAARPAFEAAFGSEHQVMASLMGLRGTALLDLGRAREARGEFERAIVLQERAIGADHPDAAALWVGLGRAELALGNTVAALAPAQRGHALREKNGGKAAELGDSRFLLAQAMWAVPASRDEARRIAEEALTSYRGAGPPAERRREEVEAWLRRVSSAGKVDK
jgi:tetratricopeptide (TPR) repeat protein/predicted Ser/Thr protein kinase